jgi:hypothetical protein
MTLDAYSRMFPVDAILIFYHEPSAQAAAGHAISRLFLSKRIFC